MHCDRARPARRGVRLAARLLGASAGLMTLMACYGMIARPYGPNEAGDSDGDGAPVTTDCDDSRPDVYPGAADVDGDGLDQNCDGVDGWRDPSAAVPVTTEPAPKPKAVATDPAPSP